MLPKNRTVVICTFFVAVYSVKLAATVQQAWKSGNHVMGKVRPYEANPGDVGPSVQLADFVFKLVQVDVLDPKAKTFVTKYQLALPTAVRSRRLNLQVVQNSFMMFLTLLVQVC